MSILSKKKTSTLWILLVQGGSYSYKVELTFTIDLILNSYKVFIDLFPVFCYPVTIQSVSEINP